MPTSTESRLPFIGREPELQVLELIIHKKSASLMVVKGRRRIGKSRLLAEFAMQHDHHYMFIGLSPETDITTQNQKDEFAKQLREQFNIPPIASDDWGDLFNWLGKLTLDGKVFIVFDEISWMAMEDPTFLPKLKNAWEKYFSKNPQLTLVLCGSVSVWIEKNILSSTGFFGRIAAEITLDELPLPDCVKLLKAFGYKGSERELLMILSVTGGVPWYIELFNHKNSASGNIKNLCFTKDGILKKEYERIFHDLFGKRGDIYRNIIDTLAEGPKDYTGISTEMQYSSGGPLSDYLDELVLSGFIRRDYMWHLNSGKEKDVSQYRLCDNYLRFYLRCIAPNLTKINKDQFRKTSLSATINLPTIIGLQFECIILQNRDLIWEKLFINPEEIINDNPYYQRQMKKQQGCQIDYLIQTKFDILYVCEIRFSQNKINSKVIHEVKTKIERLNKPRKLACKPVLIYAGELSNDLRDSGYFAHIINFSDLC